MFKRLMIITVALTIGLISLNVAPTHALIGNFASRIVWTDSYNLYASALLKGIGFCEDLAPGEECLLFCVDLYPEVANCRCQNPGQGGDNCGGLGGPFLPTTPIGGGDVIGSGDISGKGTAIGEICWSSDYIDQELQSELPPDYCMHNQNWQGICGECYLTQLDATVYACNFDPKANDGDGRWYVVEELNASDCTIDPADIPLQEGDPPLEYDCVGQSTIKYNKKNAPDCPCNSGDYPATPGGGCIDVASP